VTVPIVVLLDARSAGADEAGLRAAARRVAREAGAPHVARAYRYPYALVAWHDRPVGVDLERVAPCEPAFAAGIRTPAERAAAAASSETDEDVTSLWSAKEALAKALGDARAYDPRRLESPRSWPGGRAGPWRASPLPAPAGHVAWLCWRSSR